MVNNRFLCNPAGLHLVEATQNAVPWQRLPPGPLNFW
jgi:hypothetical protein